MGLGLGGILDEEIFEYITKFTNAVPKNEHVANKIPNDSVN